MTSSTPPPPPPPPGETPPPPPPPAAAPPAPPPPAPQASSTPPPTAPPPPTEQANVDGTEPTAPKQRNVQRALIIGLAAVVTLGVLTGGGIAVGYVLSGASAKAPQVVEPVAVGADDDEATPDPEDTPRPTSTSVVPPAPTPTVIRQFKSPSGNLRCSFDELGGVTSVTCQQELINYPIPSQACTSGAPGVFIAVNESGTYWPCQAGSIAPVETLALDTPTTQDGITCSINYTTGVTCYNRSGRGFTMEYDRGVDLF